MKLLPILVILLFPTIVLCQVTIEPHVFIAGAQIRIENEANTFITNIENKNAIQHGFGVLFQTKIFDKYFLSVNTGFSQLNNNGRYEVPLNGNLPTIDPLDFSVLRWDNSLYVSYNLLDNLFFGAGGHVVHQPSVHGNFFGKESISYHGTEFGVGVRLKTNMKRLSLTLEYYKGLQNRGRDEYYWINPIQSLGLKLGYPFNIKRNN